jgi:hypothetical protein
VIAKLRGRDARLLVEADFTIGGHAAGAVHAAPFQRYVPRRRLTTSGHLQVHVRADMLDGREFTRDVALPPRCGR